jgi:amidase
MVKGTVTVKKSFGEVREMSKRKKAVALALTGVMSLWFLSAPISLTAAQTSDTAYLTTLMTQAKSTDLSVYAESYTEQVQYAITRAEKDLAKGVPEDVLNVDRLTLQVALDTLKVDLQKAGVADLQEMIRAGQLTYTELLNMYLTRIELYDMNTVKINSVRALNPNAAALAAAADQAVAADPSKAKGIFGLPIMVKDNVGTIGSDGMPTTAGSVALADNYQPYDAPLVAEIKAAGGILLGKLNLTEFANYMTSGMPSGYSSLGGFVLNPYKPWMNTAGSSPILSPSGSSAGSGASSAAALSAVTIGTETSGSILSPTQANSIVGIKPTVGLVSRTGVVPLSSTQDTAGPMGRSVADVAALLTVVAAHDPADVVTVYGPDVLPDFSIDYTQYLKLDGLQGKRVGLYGTPSAANRAVYGEVAATLRALGATIVTNGTSGGNDQGFSASASSGIVLSYDFKKDMNAYLATLAPDFPIKTLADIIQYNSDHADVALRFGQTTLISSNNRDLEAQKETYEANKATGFANARQNGIDRLLNENNLDALFTIGGGTTGIAAVAGYPTVSVPAGYNSNAPDSTSWGCVNVGFTGTAYSEAELISMAYAYEQASHKRIAPGMAVKDGLKALVAEVDTLSDTIKGLVAVELSAAQAAAVSNFSTQKDVDETLWALQDAISGYVFSSGGVKLTKLNADRVTVSKVQRNDTDTEQSLTLYAAIYGSDGRLVGVGKTSKTVAIGALTDFVITVDVPGAAEGGYSAGAYIWEDATFMPVDEKGQLT